MAQTVNIATNIIRANQNAMKVFNILNYGALGDGFTNDTQAFEDAIYIASILGGGRVFVPDPPVAWTISTAILVPSNVWITGVSMESTLIQTDAINKELGLGRAIFYTGGTNVRFLNLKLDGRLVDDPGWVWVNGSDESRVNRSSGIELKSESRNIVIENIHAINMTRNGVLVRGENITINNIVTSNTASAGVKFGGTGLATLSDTSLANCTNGVVANNLYCSKSLGNQPIEINDGVHNVVISGLSIDCESKCPAITVHDHSNANETNTNVTIRNFAIVNGPASGPSIILEQQVNTNKNQNIVFEDGTFIGSAHYPFRIGGNAEGTILRRVTIMAKRAIIINRASTYTPAINTYLIDCDFQPNDLSDDNLPGINVTNGSGVYIQGTHVKGWRSHGVQNATGCNNVVIESSETRASEILNNGRSQADGSSVKLVGTATGSKILDAKLGNDGTVNAKHALVYVSGYDDFQMIGCEVINNGTVSNLLGSFAGTNAVVNNNIGFTDYP
jgi:hypothetical protein